MKSSKLMFSVCHASLNCSDLRAVQSWGVMWFLAAASATF
jgi:hypothetical protein